MSICSSSSSSSSSPFTLHNHISNNNHLFHLQHYPSYHLHTTSTRTRWPILSSSHSHSLRRSSTHQTSPLPVNAVFNNLIHSTNPHQYIQAYALILQTSRKLYNLQLGLQIHARMIISGVDFSSFLGGQLLDFYSKLGCTDDALKLFDRMPHRNVFNWTSLLGMYSDFGQFQETIKLFHLMIDEGVRPDHFIFPKVFKACAELKDYRTGKDIYDYMLRIGFEGNLCVKRSYLDMFIKCGRMDLARRLFEKMASKDVVMWNMIISGHVSKRDFERALKCVSEMKLIGVSPDRVTWNTILAGYAQAGQFKEAAKYLSNMEGLGELEANVVSWTALITGHVQNGFYPQALDIFRKMVLRGVRPNSTTITSVVSACTNLSLLTHGKEIHGYCINIEELDSDLFVGNSLVDFYSKCQNLDFARRKFSRIKQKDSVSWNAMLMGFAVQGCREDAIKLLHDMELQGVKPDIITWNGLITGFTQNGDGKTAQEFFIRMCQTGISVNTTSLSGVLAACSQLKDLKLGKVIHGYVVRNQMELSTGIGSALISMYSGCDALEVAFTVFRELSDKDVVIWNSIISACAKSGFGTAALNLLREMNLSAIQPDSVTMVSVLPACSKLAALRQGKEIHQYIIRHGLNSSNFVLNALIDMYGRCGSIKKSRRVFDMMSQRDVVSWNVMIAVYGMHGLGMEAVNLFSHMRSMGIKPNQFTFTNLLSACSHSGLIDVGWKHFEMMKKEYDMDQAMEQYVCMVDLMARAGQLTETLDFIEKMPFEPNAAIWGSLLGACRIHCNPEIAEYAARYLFELEPESCGHYILLANIYSTLGRWKEAGRIRGLMKERGVIKSPGCSWIEVGRKVYSFIVGDANSHPLMEKIMEKMEKLYMEIKEMGYVPETKFVLQNVPDKEYRLCGHSEKLALGFGLISTEGGSPLRIIKNLRTCGDCHSMTKYISKVENREIIMRDNYRFHHFVDGKCSCGDYW